MQSKESVFNRKKTIQLKGEILDLRTPRVLGIINITPDSFFDGSKYQHEKAILQRAEAILDEGADIIDIGGYSSRPGADDISISEEIRRVVPAIGLILKKFPDAKISIDTFRAEVAEKAIEAGACMINDISGGELDPAMFETVCKLNVPYILMHMKGNPQNMIHLNQYEDILSEILTYFEKKVYILKESGLKDIIIDPGFGFAKDIQQNFFLLKHLDYFQILGLPLLAGISRKSMIYKTLNIKAEDSLNGTTVLNTVALQNQASFLRVHDVKQAVEAIKLLHQKKSE